MDEAIKAVGVSAAAMRLRIGDVVVVQLGEALSKQAQDNEQGPALAAALRGAIADGLRRADHDENTIAGIGMVMIGAGLTLQQIPGLQTLFNAARDATQSYPGELNELRTAVADCGEFLRGRPTAPPPLKKKAKTRRKRKAKTAPKVIKA